MHRFGRPRRVLLSAHYAHEIIWYRDIDAIQILGMAKPRLRLPTFCVEFRCATADPMIAAPSSGTTLSKTPQTTSDDAHGKRLYCGSLIGTNVSALFSP